MVIPSDVSKTKKAITKYERRITKRMNYKLLLIISFLLALSCDNGVPPVEETEGTMTDIEGNVYKTIRIGNQWWMAENLRTTKYNDGTPIPCVENSAIWGNLTMPGYCYYNNDFVANAVKYGALYNDYAVNTGKLAPAGWHVPDTTDWNTLENYLIANGYNWDGTTTGNKIAQSMAAKTNWDTYSNPGTIGDDLTKNNRSGFSALPGGSRFFNGSFNYIGRNGFWWSATENNAVNAYYRNLNYDYVGLNRLNCDKGYGFSVRCVKD